MVGRHRRARRFAADPWGRRHALYRFACWHDLRHRAQWKHALDLRSWHADEQHADRHRRQRNAFRRQRRRTLDRARPLRSSTRMTVERHAVVQGVKVPTFSYGTAWKEEETSRLTTQA